MPEAVHLVVFREQVLGRLPGGEKLGKLRQFPAGMFIGLRE